MIDAFSFPSVSQLDGLIPLSGVPMALMVNVPHGEKNMAPKKEPQKVVRTQPKTPAGKLNLRGGFIVRQLRNIAKLGNARTRPTLKQVGDLRVALQDEIDSTFESLITALKADRARVVEEKFAPVVEE